MDMDINLFSISWLVILMIKMVMFVYLHTVKNKNDRLFTIFGREIPVFNGYVNQVKD